MRDKWAIVDVGLASALFQLMMIQVAECLIGPFHETFALVLAIVLLGIALGRTLADTPNWSAENDGTREQLIYPRRPGSRKAGPLFV